MITRRQVLTLGMESIIAIAFAKTVIANELLAKQLPPKIEDWIAQLYFTAAKVRTGQIDPVVWQSEMDKLYGSVDINALMTNIDMDKLKHRIDYADKGESFLFTHLRPRPVNPIDSSIPLNVETLFASVKKGCHVPPHGHANMCSAFLLVSGQMHARQYDSVHWDKEKRTLVIKETVNEMQTRGRWTSVSDHHNNCHWLTAESDDCYFFSTKLANIQPECPTCHRMPFYYEAGNYLGSGLREVPLISQQRSTEIYNL